MRSCTQLLSIHKNAFCRHNLHISHQKMSSFIFGSKNSIHIIDLVQTLEMANAALNEIHKCISTGGKILFVLCDVLFEIKSPKKHYMDCCFLEVSKKHLCSDASM